MMARPSPVKDFILSQPRDTPVSELIGAAKRAKLGVLSKSYVSKVRNEAPESHWAPKPARTVAVNGHAVEVPAENGKRPIPSRWADNLATPALMPLADNELQFRRLILVVGTERAQQLLDAYKAAAEADLS